MQYRDLDADFYGLRLWSTTDFSTPDDLVSMIARTLDDFGFLGDPE